MRFSGSRRSPSWVTSARGPNAKRQDVRCGAALRVNADSHGSRKTEPNGDLMHTRVMARGALEDTARLPGKHRTHRKPALTRISLSPSGPIRRSSVCRSHGGGHDSRKCHRLKRTDPDPLA